jgi:FMN phosphatase YigB (HAD superfamily)
MQFAAWAAETQARANIRGIKIPGDQDMAAQCVFLFDVDNTLLDNDRVTADLSDHLAAAFGAAARDRYWAIFENLRVEMGYANYLGALERYRLEEMHDPRVLQMAPWLVDYPFADRIYPGALDAVKHVERWGLPVILSDGDAVFQPVKIARSGLTRAFSDRVQIYIHKEKELKHVERLRPARRYVMIDDKIRILSAMKKIWGDRLTTIFVVQGHYAQDKKEVAKYPAADIQIDCIADLAKHDFSIDDLS